MLAVLQALRGQNVDVITSTQALARRDAEEFEHLFKYFNLTVSTISVRQPTRHDFNAQVIYGTNTDFEFALLREGISSEGDSGKIRMIDRRGNNCWSRRVAQTAIVDESDSLFLDAARNSARIAHSTGVSWTWIYSPIYQLVRSRMSHLLANTQLAGVMQQLVAMFTPSAASIRQALDTSYQDLLRSVLSNPQSTSSMEDQITKRIQQVAQLSDVQITRWIEAVVVALFFRVRDIHYVVDRRKVIIVDLDTGRLQPDSRWSNGIHEMCEVKEGIPVSPESGTIASISHPSFFEEYDCVFGITGTAGEPEERAEVTSVYGIDTFDVPPHRPCLRVRRSTRVFRTEATKYAAMVEATKVMIDNSQSSEDGMYRGARAVLILLPTIGASIKFSRLLRNAGVRHMLFNEQQQESEEMVIYRAGQVFSVTVATNTAGRGTDFKLSPALLAAGGLHVIFGCFPANLRVECQGLGRSGRQGQPGSSQIFISIDEDYIEKLMQRNHGLGLLLPSSDDATSSTQSSMAIHTLFDCVFAEEVFVAELYSTRTQEIVSISNERCRVTALERIRFETLRHFFNDIEWLAGSGLSPNCTACQTAYATIRGEDASGVNSLPLSQLRERLIEWFRITWTTFFSRLTNAQDGAALLLSPEELDDVRSMGTTSHAREATRSLIKIKSLKIYRRFLLEGHWSLSLSSPDYETSDHWKTNELLRILREHGEHLLHMELELSEVLSALRR
jgi:preprotein translocase subunit SecA